MRFSKNRLFPHGSLAMNMKYMISILLFIIALSSMSSMAEVAAHYYLLDSWGNDAPNLEIKLPDNWEYKKNKGPDFDVHWLIAPQGMGTIGIYVGHHPSFREPKDLPNMRRHVGNKEAPFYRKKNDDTTSIHAVVEGFFMGSSNAGVETLKLHVMINEMKSGFAKDAFEYLKTLRVRRTDG